MVIGDDDGGDDDGNDDGAGRYRQAGRNRRKMAGRQVCMYCMPVLWVDNHASECVGCHILQLCSSKVAIYK